MEAIKKGLEEIMKGASKDDWKEVHRIEIMALIFSFLSFSVQICFLDFAFVIDLNFGLV